MRTKDRSEHIQPARQVMNQAVEIFILQTGRCLVQLQWKLVSRVQIVLKGITSVGGLGLDNTRRNGFCVGVLCFRESPALPVWTVDVILEGSLKCNKAKMSYWKFFPMFIHLSAAQMLGPR